MSYSERSNRLRDAWRLPHPVSLPPQDTPPTPPANGALYNEFDYHELAYRHVGSNAPLVLDIPAHRLEADAAAAWRSRMSPELIDLLAERVFPAVHHALHNGHAVAGRECRVHMSYALGKSAPYDVYEHRLLIQLDEQGQAAYHREWVQRSSRRTETVELYLVLSVTSDWGGQHELLRETFQPPCIFDTALTEREQEIAHHVVQGLNSQAVAAEVFLSRHTVDTHRRAILAKTGVGSTAELMALAQRLNWKWKGKGAGR